MITITRYVDPEVDRTIVEKCEIVSRQHCFELDSPYQIQLLDFVAKHSTLYITEKGKAPNKRIFLMGDVGDAIEPIAYIEGDVTYDDLREIFQTVASLGTEREKMDDHSVGPVRIEFHNATGVISEFLTEYTQAVIKPRRLGTQKERYISAYDILVNLISNHLAYRDIYSIRDFDELTVTNMMPGESVEVSLRVFAKANLDIVRPSNSNAYFNQQVIMLLNENN